MGEIVLSEVDGLDSKGADVSDPFSYGKSQQHGRESPLKKWTR